MIVVSMVIDTVANGESHTGIGVHNQLIYTGVGTSTMIAKIPLTGVNPARARWNAVVEIADLQPISFLVEAAGP